MRAINRWMLAILCSLAFIAMLRADESGITWVRNLDDAKRIAAAENKDVLINFTGLGWCAYCKLIEHEVFGRPEFAPAAKDFVLVELDYPGSDDLIDANLRDSYQEWRATYRIRVYPTVILADASGKPYAYTGYYEKDLTPAKFLDKLKSYRDVRQTRDAAIAAANGAAGVARAKQLDLALTAIAPALGKTDQWHEDRLLVFYRDLVDEVRRLDADNAAGLRNRYDERIARSENDAVVVTKDLERLQAKRDSAAVIAYVDEVLPGVHDEELRWRLETARSIHLQISGQYEKGLENVRRLLEAPSKTFRVRENLFYQEAAMLIHLGRTDEAMAIYDERIADAAERPTERTEILRDKAQVLVVNRAEPQQTIAACRQFQAATEPHSNPWGYATSLLAGSLTRAEHYQEALEVQQELLKFNDANKVNDAWLLLQSAKNQRGNRLPDAARKSLDAAVKGIDELKTTQADKPSAQRKAVIARCEEELDRLRKLIGSGD